MNAIHKFTKTLSYRWWQVSHIFWGIFTPGTLGKPRLVQPQGVPHPHHQAAALRCVTSCNAEVESERRGRRGEDVSWFHRASEGKSGNPDFFQGNPGFGEF